MLFVGVGLPLAAAAYDADVLRQALARPILPPSAATSSWARAFTRVKALDQAADDAWLGITSRAQYDAYRKSMRAAMLKSMGGLPPKTPLNARVTRRVKGAGWAADCVVFESMPGVFVTGNLFLPDDPRFKPPYPAVLVTCGHAENAKGSAGYNRMAALLAKNGIAGFIVDPMDQGERRHDPFVFHDVVGIRAILTGLSLSGVFVFDNMRALDYLETRGEIDASRLGCCGNSGGGTAAAMLMAADERIKAAAPSCYLTRLTELCETIGPQDAEQNIPDQLAFGLNHAGLVLTCEGPVLQCGTRGDFFSYDGFTRTHAAVKALASKIGLAERYDTVVVDGRHGWREPHRLGTVAWFRRWLCGDKSALPMDRAAMDAADREWKKNGFKGLDTGLVTTEDDTGCEVVPGGRTHTLAGHRDWYGILRERLRALERLRPAMSPRERAEKARALAKIGKPEPFTAVKVGADETIEDLTLSRYALTFADGFALPAVLITAPDMKLDPTIVCTDSGRGDALGGVESVLYRKKRSPMLVVDLSGWGEIVTARGKACEEKIAWMYYMTGETLVGKRTENLLCCVRFLQDRFGKDISCDVIAGGRAAIPVWHAAAAEPGAFGSVAMNNAPTMSMAPAPKSWSDTVRIIDGIPPIADVVPWALAVYDWTDLMEDFSRTKQKERP